MKFSQEMLEHVALAARIEVTGKEQQYTDYLEQMTDRLIHLAEMDLASTTPTGRIAPHPSSCGSGQHGRRDNGQSRRRDCRASGNCR